MRMKETSERFNIAFCEDISFQNSGSKEMFSNLLKKIMVMSMHIMVRERKIIK